MQRGSNSPIWTKRFIYLFLINMSVFFVFYSLVTILPLYTIDVLKQTEKEGALLLSAFLLTAILVRPFSGKLLDYFGKKKLLMISLVFYFLSTVLYVVVKPLILLLVLRAFNGIWFSVITTALGALAADIIPANRKGAGLGYFTISGNLSVVLGPFVGLVISQYSSYNVLFFVLSAVVIIGSMLAKMIQTDDLLQPATVSGPLTISFNDLIEKKALAVAGMAALVAFSYASVLSFIATYAQHLGFVDLVRWFYVVFAVAMMLTRPMTGKMYDQRGPQWVIIPGFIFYAIGILCLAFVNGPLLFLVTGMFVGVGYGALVTSLQSLAVQSVDYTRSGYATATFFTFFDLGIAVGTYILGVVVVGYGYLSVYLITSSLVIVNLMIYLIRLRRTKI